MKKLFLLSLVGMLAGSVVWAGEKVNVKVKGMVCSFCAQGLDKKFKAEPAVEKVNVSLKDKLIQVELKNNQQLSDESIKKIVHDAGYNVHSITRDSK